MPGARETMVALSNAGLKQGILADGQAFSVPQLLQCLDEQERLPPRTNLLTSHCVVISSDVGVRKPSATLFETARERFAEIDIDINQVLYISSRLGDDLGIAKQQGFRTALFAGDKLSLQATAAECRDPVLKPDRLITELRQVLNLVGLT